MVYWHKGAATWSLSLLNMKLFFVYLCHQAAVVLAQHNGSSIINVVTQVIVAGNVKAIDTFGIRPQLSVSTTGLLFLILSHSLGTIYLCYALPNFCDQLFC